MGCDSSNTTTIAPPAKTIPDAKEKPVTNKPGVKNIIITGAPASGKGTQCERIVEKYGVVHISTGDLLRAAVKGGSELGKQANEFMTTGKLVPDELVINLVKEKLNTAEVKEKGWLLDGFPRTDAQAKAIDSAGIHPTHVILLDVPDSILTDRAVGRRLDPITGKIYHITSNPPPEGEIAARVIQRDDDVEEKVVKRLEQYHSNLAALSEAYKDILVKVDGNKAPADVFAAVDKVLSPGAENAPPGAENAPPGAENAPPGDENAPSGAENAPPGAENAPPANAAPTQLVPAYVVVRLGKQELKTKKVENAVWGEEIVFNGLGQDDDDVVFALHDSDDVLLGLSNMRLTEYVDTKKRATISVKNGDAAVGVLEADIEIKVQEEPEAITGVFFVDKFTNA